MSQITVTEQETDNIILGFLEKHSKNIQVDLKKFFDLLKHSLSLDFVDKKKVIDAIPSLVQKQFDDLINVFIDERVKFKELAKEHKDDIKKLVQKQKTDWLKLGEIYKAEIENQKKELEARKKEEEIKKSLGL